MRRLYEVRSGCSCWLCVCGDVAMVDPKRRNLEISDFRIFGVETNGGVAQRGGGVDIVS